MALIFDPPAHNPDLNLDPSLWRTDQEQDQDHEQEKAN
jgi:hypothetical protein